MLNQKDIVYLYDGTFTGFLCCVFESFAKKEIPADICPEHFWQPTLYNTKYIENELSKAVRVEGWISEAFSASAKSMLQEAFLSVMQQKEYHLLCFIHLCRLHPDKAPNMLQNPSVLELNKALVTIRREASKWLGLLRFADYNGVLISVINPLAFVLPLLQGHFCDRYSTECFFIFDETNKAGLISEYGVGRLVEVDTFSLPVTTENEIAFQNLWKKFVKTIAIKERTNPALQMNMMPKRYWKHLTEKQIYLNRQNNLTINKKEEH